MDQKGDRNTRRGGGRGRDGAPGEAGGNCGPNTGHSTRPSPGRAAQSSRDSPARIVDSPQIRPTASKAGSYDALLTVRGRADRVGANAERVGMDTCRQGGEGEVLTVFAGQRVEVDSGRSVESARGLYD